MLKNRLNSPSQMHPMLPGDHRWDELVGKAALIRDQASRSSVPIGQETTDSLRQLVRSMNSYYSNRIEGHGTHPLNIERALRDGYSESPQVARLQRLAVAHIDAEKEAELVLSEGIIHPLSAQAIQMAHTQIYKRLDEQDRITDDGVIVLPGMFRSRDVKVGHHVPPSHEHLDAFLSEFDFFYDKPWSIERGIIAAACAHHRMAWIHPFFDGNGRAVRLQTHLALLEITKGLWSVNRGFARTQADYYQYLAAADSPRRGDLDGRGQLSESGLLSWVDYFINTCLDQASFIYSLLDTKGIKDRIAAWVHVVHATNPRIRSQAILPLHHLFLVGSVTRAEFNQMTGLGERTARYQMSALLDLGVLISESKHSPVRFGFPVGQLHILMPGLYPEAAVSNPDDSIGITTT